MYVSLETNTHSLNDKSTQSPPGISDMNISELNVGALIKNARQKKGLSQKDLAKRCGITPVQLCRIENNECIPSKKTLQMLSGHIGISYTTLIIEAGYNSMSGKNVYYKTDGTELDVNCLVRSIYNADSDLLDYFHAFEYFESTENIEVLKLLLVAMRKEADICHHPDTKKDPVSRLFKSTFQALKKFIISSLRPITE